MAQPDFTAVLHQVLCQIGERFADSCGVRLISEDGRSLCSVGTYHRDPVAQALLHELNAAPVPIAVGAMGQVAVSGEPLFLPVVDPTVQAAAATILYGLFLERFPFWSLMIVPLRSRGRVLGTVNVTRSAPDQPFTRDDLQLLIDLADRAALAIDNAQLYASLEQAHAVAEANAARIGRLQRLTSALADALTPQDVAQVVVNDGTRVLGAQAGMVALIAADDGASLEIVGATGYHEAAVRPWQRFPLGAALPSSDAVRMGQLILTSSHDELIARYPHLAERRWAAFESRAAIPLHTEREPLGVLLLSFTGPRRFSAEEQDLMLLIGRQCAQALERARLYAREQQARAEAEAAVRVREQFLSIAAHELKTPLTPLLGQAQLLERRAQRAGQLTEHDRRALRVIASQAQRLDQLVRSMLDLTRLQTGRLTLKRAPLDLCDLARQLADELQPTLERHQVALDLPEGPVIVDGDPLRLEQVLLNLLQNAIKYSPSGGLVRLGVALQSDHAVLEVRDWGIGVPAEDLPRLFEPFFWAANAEQRVLSGMGVGLAVVKEIVTLHGGTVVAASVEGQGSTFTITLPRADTPRATQHPQ
ncbi:MAG: GAF domain-containing protein [Chloroflexales bacterium]|nr:GAF domain-containing protein [Chloroflexales bacterium]